MLELACVTRSRFPLCASPWPTLAVILLGAATAPLPAPALTVTDFEIGFAVGGLGLDVGAGGSLPPNRQTENISVPLGDLAKSTFTFANQLFVQANAATDMADDSRSFPKFLTKGVENPGGGLKFDVVGNGVTISRKNPNNRGVAGFDNHARARSRGVVSELTALYAFRSVVKEKDLDNRLIKAEVTASVDVVRRLKVPDMPVRLVFGSYIGVASVTDPFVFAVDDLTSSGLDALDFSWFQPFQLTEFSFGPASDRAYAVFFWDGVVERELFGLRRDTSGLLDVTWDPDTAFFALSDLDATPDLDTTPPLDMNAFAAGLLADLAADGVLSAPLALGALATRLAADPGGDGSVAFGYRSGEGEREFRIGRLGQVPVPPAALLLCSALVLLGLRGAGRARPG